MIVVFDLDGTLINSSKSILKSHKAAWSSVGAKCPPENEILRLTGLPLIEIMQKLGPEHDSKALAKVYSCLLYTSPSPRDLYRSRMPSSA